MSKRLAVMMQMYYVELWDEFRDYLKNIVDPFDLYVTMADDVLSIDEFQEMSRRIKRDFPQASTTLVQNKGLDIGPFLLTLNSVLNRGVDYDYVMKLHTKRSIHTMGEGGDGWRKELVDALLLNPQKYIRNRQLFDDNEVGMVGAKKWVTSHVETNSRTVDYYKAKLGVPKGKDFIGGTVFLMRFEILKKYLTTDNILAVYKELETGYFKDWEAPTKTHALERMFGYMTQNSGYRIVGV